MSTRKESKHRVIAFRMTETRGRTLDKFVVEASIVGIKGANDFARKLLYDWQDGKLDYKNPADLSIDPSLLS